MFKTRFLSTLFFYGHKMGRFVVHIFITCTRKGVLMCISTRLHLISGGWKSRHTGRATTMVEPCYINFVPLFIHGRHVGRPLRWSNGGLKWPTRRSATTIVPLQLIIPFRLSKRDTTQIIVPIGHNRIFFAVLRLGENLFYFVAQHAPMKY